MRGRRGLLLRVAPLVAMSATALAFVLARRRQRRAAVAQEPAEAAPAVVLEPADA
jgi:hypothetical protein